MHLFNNQAYTVLVTDLLSDAMYLDGRSNRGKISSIRQYAEVVVRKILDLPPDVEMTLGKREINEGLRTHSGDNVALMTEIDNIRKLGNKCTHTAETSAITDDDVRSAFNSLFEVYAYLFVDYFKKHSFGSDGRVMSSFSIMPPIIRYIVLGHLYEMDNENVAVIDRFSLAILKACGEEKAREWLLERRDSLSGMKTISDVVVENIRRMYGPEVAQSAIDGATDLFSHCMDRISGVALTLNEKGRLYEDFESAVELFHEKGKIADDSPEIIKFNSLMEFVYLGRKPKENLRLGDKDNYLTIN